MHTRGQLWRLVRASMTLVGLVPPVYENGELLVDGGYLNNAPIDVMRAKGVATVCAVVLSPIQHELVAPMHDCSTAHAHHAACYRLN